MDLSQLYSEYQTRLDNIQNAISSITDFESNIFSKSCYPTSSDDLEALGNAEKYEHKNGEYPSNNPHAPHDSFCPFVEADLYLARLRWIETTSFLTFYFQHPTAIRGQNMLEGLSKEK